jgi:dihydrofolate reductase
MRISVIVAMGTNRVIGDERGLPWRLPADLRRFRELTWGKPIVMGRTTFELIGKPLPGRDSIVLTRDPAYRADGVHVAHGVEEALDIGRRLAQERGVQEVMIIGGAEVYRQLLPFADRVYLTVVEGEFSGGATFPFEQMEAVPWTLLSEQAVPADDRNEHAHRFYVLERALEGARTGVVEPARLLAG